MFGEDDFARAGESSGRAYGADDGARGAPRQPRRPPVEDNRPLPPLHSIKKGVVKAIVKPGAIVDLGEYHSGLVHLSQLSSAGKVEDASEVVASGEVVWVKVIAVDEEARRVSLSMKAASQTDGADRDPMHLEAEKISRGKLRAANKASGGGGAKEFSDDRAITLGAVYDTTCAKCGGKGHMAFECFSYSLKTSADASTAVTGQRYELVGEDEGELPRPAPPPPAARPLPVASAMAPSHHALPSGLGRGVAATMPAWMTAAAAAAASSQAHGSSRGDGTVPGATRDGHRGHRAGEGPTKRHRAGSVSSDSDDGDSGSDDGEGRDGDGRRHRRKHHRHRRHRDRDGRDSHRGRSTRDREDAGAKVKAASGDRGDVEAEGQSRHRHHHRRHHRSSGRGRSTSPSSSSSSVVSERRRRDERGPRQDRDRALEIVRERHPVSDDTGRGSDKHSERGRNRSRSRSRHHDDRARSTRERRG